MLDKICPSLKTRELIDETRFDMSRSDKNSERYVLHLNIAHFDKCRKCRMILSTVASVACHSQVSQTSNKAYFHDDDTKETSIIAQTLGLEEEEAW